MTNINRAALPVLVGIDGSESALEAARWAAREAQRRNVGVRLVNAFGLMITGYPGDIGLGLDFNEVLLPAARESVRAAAAAVEQIVPGLEITQDVPMGNPVPQLVEESKHAQLVVVGDRGLGGFTGLLLGSVAVAVAAHAACPVVVVRGVESSDGPVVVGVDGSPTSEAALAFAFDTAAARGASLVAVHTWQDVFVAPEFGALLDWSGIEAGEQQVLAERLAGWAEKFPDVAVRRVVACDRPGHTLVEQSAGAQLVVVGSRGRGSFVGLVLGSVSQALLHHATCPVAVVRPGAADGSP